MMVAVGAPDGIASSELDLPGTMRPRGNGTFAFTPEGQAPIQFKPYYAVRDELTTTYFKLKKRNIG